MYDYDTVEVTTTGGVTTAALDRPEKRNAMNPRMHREMADLLRRLAVDDDTKALVVTGNGSSFCAGQDLKEYFHEIRDDERAREEARRDSHDWRYRLLNHFPKPTIAAVNGYCFGGAFTIVASCDIAVTADEATFGLSEVNWGHIPGGMVTKIVADLMPPRQALFYIMTGRTFDGPEAVRIGLATLSVPLDALSETVNGMAEELVQKDPLALRACKEAFKSVDIKTMSTEAALAWLSAKSDQLRRRQEAQGRSDGAESFLNKEYRPGFAPMPQAPAR